MFKNWSDPIPQTMENLSSRSCIQNMYEMRTNMFHHTYCGDLLDELVDAPQAARKRSDEIDIDSTKNCDKVSSN
jgi:hypothetical protein